MRCCSATSCSRMAGTIATADAALVTSPLRSKCPTGSLLSFTLGGRLVQSKLIRQCRATKANSRGSSRLARRLIASSPMARYIAPVSRKSNANRSATASATLDFPVPAGPSMVMIIRVYLLFAPPSPLYPGERVGVRGRASRTILFPGSFTALRRPFAAPAKDCQMRFLRDGRGIVPDRTVKYFSLAIHFGPQHRHINQPIGNMRAIGDGELRGGQHLVRRVDVHVILFGLHFKIAEA